MMTPAELERAITHQDGFLAGWRAAERWYRQTILERDELLARRIHGLQLQHAANGRLVDWVVHSMPYDQLTARRHEHQLAAVEDHVPTYRECVASWAAA